MRNQPKYNFIKNTSYALKGLKNILFTESSFRIELIIMILSLPLIYLIDTSITNKILLLFSLLLVLLSEAINSAIERVVDLVTLEQHTLAGQAKDAGSAAVFIAITIAALTWIIIVLDSLHFL